jgi:hypothetical protein
VPRVFEGFRAVGKEDGTGALRCSAPRGFQIVRAIKVRIVDAGEPEFFPVALDREVLVEQDAEPGRFEMRGDLDNVVVAEDGQGARTERGGNARDVGQAVVEISGWMVGEITSDDGKIVRCSCDEIEQTVGETFHTIEMQIGKMEQTEAIECGWQIGQRLIADDGADIEAVGASARGQAGDAEQAVDHAVDRHDALDDKRSFALVDKARPQVGLTLQALAEKR